jgi:hypothetical protein
MNRLGTLLITSAVCATVAAAQTPPSPDNRTSGLARSTTDTRATATTDATITTTLVKSLDSKKVKQGDPITARTIEPVKKNGQTVIPSGANIEGHVTQASAKQKGDPYSTLGIVFDKAVLKNGEQIPLNATVQAIAAPQEVLNAPSNTGMDTAPMGNGAPQTGGMSQPGRPSTIPSAPTVPQTAEANGTGQPTAAGLSGNGRLTPNSRGVYGLNGISMKESTLDNQQTAVLTSTNKTVHLDSGTQLLLVAQAL